MTSFWALGEYGRIAELIADMGPDLVAAARIGPGQRVLDVGAGTGNAALAAAAAGAEVVATDITPELMAVGERTALQRGLAVRWLLADAQDLPFPDGRFDVVLSAVGAVFAPDHEATARELLRVCRPGGVVAMANWTPNGAAGRFFEVLGRYRPTTAGPPPTAWGVPSYVAELFAAADVTAEPRTVRLAFTGPPAELCAYYRRHFAPVIAARDALDPERTARLDDELLQLFVGEDSGPPGGPSRYDYDYLLVLATPTGGLRPRARPRGAAAAAG